MLPGACIASATATQSYVCQSGECIGKCWFIISSILDIWLTITDTWYLTPNPVDFLLSYIQPHCSMWAWAKVNVHGFQKHLATTVASSQNLVITKPCQEVILEGAQNWLICTYSLLCHCLCMFESFRGIWICPRRRLFGWSASCKQYHTNESKVSIRHLCPFSVYLHYRQRVISLNSNICLIMVIDRNIHGLLKMSRFCWLGNTGPSGW